MYSAGFFLLLVLLLLATIKCNSEAEMQECHASCGPLANIISPFGLEQSPKPGCPGPKPGYNVACKSNRAIFYFKERPYYVMDISYKEGSMWLIDPALQRDNCSSLLSYGSSFLQGDNSREEFYVRDFYDIRVVYVNCLVPVKDPAYVPAAPCRLSSSPTYLYAILSNYSMSIRRLNTSCKVVMNIPASFADDETATTHSQIVSILMRGFQVVWRYSVCSDTIAEDCLRGWGCDIIDMIDTWKRCSSCERSSKWHQCYLKNLGRYLKDFWTVVSYNVFYRPKDANGFQYYGYIDLYLLGRTAIGILCFSIFLVYKLRKKHIWMDTTVEEFLSNYRYQMLRR